MYEQYLNPKEATLTEKKSVATDEADEISKHILEKYSPREIVEILNRVKENAQYHWRCRIEAAVKEIEVLKQTAEPLF